MALRPTSYLLIGDYITLKYLKLNAYITGEGILTEDINAIDRIESFEDHLFQVCIQLQYSGNTNTITTIAIITIAINQYYLLYYLLYYYLLYYY
jgi:hypothetical protein